MNHYSPACGTPVKRAALVNWWEGVTFLHWPYEPDAVERLLPPGLEVETRDGAAWVGLVLFRMRVGLPVLPPVPWLLTFPETNVRTYVRMRDGTPGVWFFSLDAARLAPVLVGRSAYRLRYCWSKMSITRSGAIITYSTHRRWPGPRGAMSEAGIEIGEPYAPDEPGDLDHFLTARWTMFSPGKPVLHHARAFHEPWPLHHARVVRLYDELVPASGLPAPHREPLAHYAPSVEVRIGWPSRVPA
ncbi:MAG: uncharacterized protein QOH66_32 [Actinomycetota bacterium]|nr:uncharacterized protein [Actinomycetota bacterium]